MTFRTIAFPNLAQAAAHNPSNQNPSEKILVVLLHGWGANAQDVASMAPYLQLDDHPSAVHMLFPNGTFPHTVQGEMGTPGGRMWYAIPSDYQFDAEPDVAGQEHSPDGLLKSRRLLTEWLQGLEAQTGIPLSRTIMAGFSQGGAMTLDVGTRLPLAGLMILSGYLHDDLSDRSSPLPPILMVHGRQDPVVPIVAAHQSRDRLTALNANLDYHELDMGHDIPLTVLELMQTFIGRVFISLGKTEDKVL